MSSAPVIANPIPGTAEPNSTDECTAACLLMQMVALMESKLNQDGLAANYLRPLTARTRELEAQTLEQRAMMERQAQELTASREVNSRDALRVRELEAQVHVLLSAQADAKLQLLAREMEHKTKVAEVEAREARLRREAADAHARAVADIKAQIPDLQAEARKTAMDRDGLALRCLDLHQKKRALTCAASQYRDDKEYELQALYRRLHHLEREIKFERHTSERLRSDLDRFDSFFFEADGATPRAIDWYDARHRGPVRRLWVKNKPLTLAITSHDEFS